MKNAKKILLVTSKNLDLDTYISLHILAEVIKQDLGKEVELGLEGELPTSFQSVYPIDTKQLKTLPPRSFVIELKNQDNKVRNIQWNQADDKLSLFLTMEKGSINPSNLDVKPAGSDHDLIMIVGANSLNDLGKLYSESTNLFEETDVVVFSKNPNIKLPKAKIMDSQKTSSVTEQVYHYLSDNGIKVDSTRAGKVLSGIFAATNNFKKNLGDYRTYETAATLTKLGATNEAAASAVAKAGTDTASSAQTSASEASDSKLEAPSKPESKPTENKTANVATPTASPYTPSFDNKNERSSS